MKEGIRIGYFDEFEQLEASKTSKRAVHIAKEALERRGYTLVKIDFPKELFVEAKCLVMAILANLSAKPLLDTLDSLNEPILPIYGLMKFLVGLPRPLLRLY